MSRGGLLLLCAAACARTGFFHDDLPGGDSGNDQRIASGALQDQTWDVTLESGVVASGMRVTATATDTAGNSSALTNPPVSVQ